jgi:hypothetical protein
MKLIKMNTKFIEVFWKEKLSEMVVFEHPPSKPQYIETRMLYSLSDLGS